MLDRISSLTPQEFENLTFDCVRAVGLRNVVWRTPGADGGRDIEGIAYTTDISGHEEVVKWYVECKRYSSSLDWPTVYAKVAYADVQNADVLLVCTNNNPSPVCETKIAEWNAAKRRPVIRFWRGYDLPALLRRYLHIAVSYGLVDDEKYTEASFLPLSLFIQKATQAAYGADQFGYSPSAALEAASSASELLSRNLSNLKTYGHLPTIEVGDAKVDYPWVQQAGNASSWDGLGLRAVLASLRYMSNSDAIEVVINEKEATVSMTGGPARMALKMNKDIEVIGLWGRVEVSLTAEHLVELRNRLQH